MVAREGKRYFCYNEAFRDLIQHKYMSFFIPMVVKNGIDRIFKVFENQIKDLN